MKPDRTGHRWILEWRDASADPDHDIHETADSVAEGHEAIRRILNGETWTPAIVDDSTSDQPEPAYPALLREAFDGDLHTGLLALADMPLTFRCDDGTLTVQRLR